MIKLVFAVALAFLAIYAFDRWPGSGDEVAVIWFTALILVATWRGRGYKGAASALLPAVPDGYAPLTDDQLWEIREHVAGHEVTRHDDSRTICVKHGRAVEQAVLAAAPPPPAVPHRSHRRGES